MLFQLSSFARQRLEQAHDGKIPSAAISALRAIEYWEQEQRRQIGAAEAARLTLHHAVLEAADRGAEYALRRRIAALPGQDSVAREAAVIARAELISALDWIDQCTLEYRNALRKEAGA